MRRATFAAAAILAVVSAGATFAQADQRPSSRLIDGEVVDAIREFAASPVIWKSVVAQNNKRYGISQDQIDDLDARWVAERESDDQPLIASVLTGPVSSYLLRIQAGSLGLYTEIFVTDVVGLNVGQSAITSDYWQGDEAKFQKTFGVSPDAVFIDEMEFDDERGIWLQQVNMTIAHPETGEAIGHITCEVNLTELERRRAGNVTM